MKTYEVSFQIDIEAENEDEAILEFRKIVSKIGASVFGVKELED